MIKVQEIILVIRNARDKVQVSHYILNQDINNYIIQRSTGQFLGKMTKQPDVLIEKGKAKRSVLQQADSGLCDQGRAAGHIASMAE